MKKIILSIFALILISTVSKADIKIGLEGGLGWADMRAEETAQILANASGSTVTYTYDEATWTGRVFADYSLNEDLSIEMGYFLTGSLDATYTISGASATEGYNARGVDIAAVVHSDDVFFKAGMHSSELAGDATLTIGGTSYSVTETISGTGFLAGGGVEIDGTRYGATYYSALGGDSDSGMVVLYVGMVF
jgi:hypothetical protein